jgi:uncharacterized protein (DUF1015 family)
MNVPFKKANILLPKNTEMEKWAVVACDQYTSEPEYWKEVENIVGDAPSTLKITLPEIYLEQDNVQERIANINKEMDHLLSTDFFKTLDNSLIYLERTGADGKVRKGLIGMVDLEDYSYEKGSQSLIRATEGTVLERIPPRVRVRENASLELPHVMLLIDDEKKEIIEGLTDKVTSEDVVYDFDLMQNGGHVKGYKVPENLMDGIFKGLEELADKDNFEAKYNVKDKGVLLFSVGDGNHSLATAKACYENLKKTMSEEEAKNSLARYALVEVVNLHSDALEFEPIHRVVFGVEPAKMIEEFEKYYDVSRTPGEGQKVEYVYEGKNETLYIKNPKSNLAVGSLQMFIDAYIKEHAGKVDYIHGDDVTKELGSKPGNIGFLLPPMAKTELFKTVILDGALPRKTFSMGHSYDKRYYLEARKIK